MSELKYQLACKASNLQATATPSCSGGWELIQVGDAGGLTGMLSALTLADSFQIVGAFLGLSATAWGVAQIARLIFNR